MFAHRQTLGHNPWKLWKQWNRSLVASFALHGALVLALMVHFRPVFVQSAFMVRGNEGSAILIYTAQSPHGVGTESHVAQKLVKARLAQRRKSQRQARKAKEEQKMENPVVAAGSLYGSQREGATTGDEVRPALPVVFPDPPRSGIPENAIGDVIVEITIDAQGNVVDEKVLQTLGFGIEERVVEVLRGWRFRPATRNGVAI